MTTEATRPEGHFKDRFGLAEKILLRLGFLLPPLLAAWTMFQDAPSGGAFYLVFFLAGMGLVIFRWLCPRCPYPFRYGDCLFLPYTWLQRWLRFREDRLGPGGRLGILVVMIGIFLLPQPWLVAHPLRLLVFWLLAAPTLWYTARRLCHRCRNLSCPLNRVPRELRG